MFKDKYNWELLSEKSKNGISNIKKMKGCTVREIISLELYSLLFLIFSSYSLFSVHFNQSSRCRIELYLYS